MCCCRWLKQKQSEYRDGVGGLGRRRMGMLSLGVFGQLRELGIDQCVDEH